MLLHYAGDPSILCWPADDQQLSKYTLESVLYYLIASSLLYMRCVAVGATLSSLTSLISSHSHRTFNSFLLSQSVHVYLLHTVCVMNMDGPLAKYIHSGQQIHIILCLCVCVWWWSAAISLWWFGFVGFYLSACGRLSHDVYQRCWPSTKECADRCCCTVHKSMAG